MGWLFRNNRGRNIGRADKEVKVNTNVPSRPPEDRYFIVDGEQTFPSTWEYIDKGIKDGFLEYSHTARRTVMSKQVFHHFYLFIG
jgi:hypothetical protein